MAVTLAAFIRASVALHVTARNMLLAVVLASAYAWTAGDVLAENYPTRTIKILTNSSAGGTYDIFARALASELHKRWGQPVIVEPRPGGNFMIAGRACAESTSDGHTLCVLSGETLVYSELLYKNVPYDPRKDFVPVTNLFFNTQALVAAAILNINTLDELVLLAKKTPLAFSAPAVAQRLFLERLIRDKGMNMVSVPFRGGGEAITALLNGSTPVLFSGGVNFPPLIREGKIIGLAVDSPKRSPLFPQVPTLAELGYPEKLNRNYVGLVLPAATPQAVVDRVYRQIIAVMNDPIFRLQQLIDRALEPIADTPDEFSQFLDEDRSSFDQVVRDAKIERQ
jgi:tripartite-type tricarboxylate transporter receptor subunit TctC